MQHREDEVEDEADKEELSHLTNISLIQRSLLIIVFLERTQRLT